MWDCRGGRCLVFRVLRLSGYFGLSAEFRVGAWREQVRGWSFGFNDFARSEGVVNKAV